MKPYSQDLRERVIATVKAGEETQVEIASTFGIHLSTLEKWWHRWQASKKSAPLPHRSGPQRTLQSYEAFLRAEVKREPDVTLEELCTQVAKVHGVSASPSMMCRELKRLRLPRKKSRFTTASVKPRA